MKLIRANIEPVIQEEDVVSSIVEGIDVIDQGLLKEKLEESCVLFVKRIKDFKVGEYDVMLENREEGGMFIHITYIAGEKDGCPVGKDILLIKDEEGVRNYEEGLQLV